MSMTKPVVGVAILMMIEEGKVRLNDPVSRFIPQFKNLKVAVAQPAPAGGGGGGAAAQGAAPAAPRFYTVPAEREITIKDLLTHTSGLVSGTMSNSEAGKPDVRLKAKESNADYIPRLGGVPLEFQPGSRWAYSAQAGFDTLVLVVEVASGQKFDQFAQQRIFGPLGMKDTYFYTSDESFKPRIATRYNRTDKGLVKVMNEANFMNGVFFSGGGGLFTTAEDYLQFGLMLLNGGQLNGKRLLSSADGRADAVRARAGHVARPAARRRLWPERPRRERRGAKRDPLVQRVVRLERRVWHLLLRRSQGKNRRRSHDADVHAWA